MKSVSDNRLRMQCHIRSGSLTSPRLNDAWSRWTQSCNSFLSVQLCTAVKPSSYTPYTLRWKTKANQSRSLIIYQTNKRNSRIRCDCRSATLEQSHAIQCVLMGEWSEVHVWTNSDVTKHNAHHPSTQQVTAYSYSCTFYIFYELQSACTIYSKIISHRKYFSQSQIGH